MGKQRRQSRRINVGPIDLRKRVDHLARAIEQIEILLRRPEQDIPPDARDPIHQLRREAREQLLVLRDHEREAMRILIHLSRVPTDTWGDLGRAADRALKEAQKNADSIIERCRRIVSD